MLRWSMPAVTKAEQNLLNLFIMPIITVLIIATTEETLLFNTKSDNKEQRCETIGQWKSLHFQLQANFAQLFEHKLFFDFDLEIFECGNDWRFWAFQDLPSILS